MIYIYTRYIYLAAALKIMAGQYECYKKLASRSWPVLLTLNIFFSYTYTALKLTAGQQSLTLVTAFVTAEKLR